MVAENIPAYQQRVYDELNQLKIRYDALSQFIDSTNFSTLDFSNRKLLIQQQHVMKSYIDILLARIKLFKSE